MMMAETGLIEVEIEEKDSRIRVVRGVAVSAAANVTAAAPAPAPAAAAAPAPPPPAAGPHPGAITSPMVGVAYLKPEPGAPDFVTAGQQVQAGDVVMLIEAMKTFNQIKAPKSGVVRQILVANSDPVEYGQELMIVE
jgi:acetyl-CoA carboxylase biotin carboxyl carrier protein